MADNDGYKLITVTAAEEDEVVFAGEPGEELQEVPDDKDGHLRFPGGEAEKTPDSHMGSDRNASADEAIQPVQQSDSSPHAQRQAPSSKPKVSRAARQPATPGKDDYRETTLEDLESTPMPLAQKVVIIAAIVCIIGALVYYFVAMR